MAYASNSVCNPAPHLRTGVTPPVGIVAELLQVYACDVGQGLPCDKVFRIAELGPSGQMIFKFQIPDEFFRQGVAILNYPLYMLT